MKSRSRVALVVVAGVIVVAGAVAASMGSGAIVGQREAEYSRSLDTLGLAANGGDGSGQGGDATLSGVQERPEATEPSRGAQAAGSEVPTSLVYDLVDALDAAGMAPMMGVDLIVEYESVARDAIVMRGSFESTEAAAVRFELRDGTWVHVGGE